MNLENFKLQVAKKIEYGFFFGIPAGLIFFAFVLPVTDFSRNHFYILSFVFVLGYLTIETTKDSLKKESVKNILLMKLLKYLSIISAFVQGAIFSILFVFIFMKATGV